MAELYLIDNKLTLSSDDIGGINIIDFIGKESIYEEKLANKPANNKK